MTDDRTIGPENTWSESSVTGAYLPPAQDTRASIDVSSLPDADIGSGIVLDADPALNAEAELASIVEKTLNDPGAAFTPESLEALAKLKKENRASFEALRSKLKDVGCRVSALDDAVAEEYGPPSERSAKQADVLVELAEQAELFHTLDQTAYADLTIDDHRETWPVRSKGFRHWLTRRYYDVEEGAASSAALQSALSTIEAKAHYGAPERAVHLRVAGSDGRLYLDLCDESWRAVEIDKDGWRIIGNPPVRFRRTAGMQPLPAPLAGGSVDTLRSFLNLKTDADFVLVVAWLLATFRYHGPYPVIALAGEQGSAKSTFSGLVRSLVDPNTAPLRALPREDRDLFIAANNGHVLAFDNVSGLPVWLSDTLCRLATGGGFAVRQLYTDQDEVLFDAAKPVILNGIEDFVTQPDLADRALFLTLEPIPEAQRRPQAELSAMFKAERPRILGVLLNAVVTGLNRLPETKLKTLPRMADFALWGTACETAFWPAGTFEAAYRGNRDEAVDNVIDADPIASALRTMMTTLPTWNGTATQLLAVLVRGARESSALSKTWPKSPRALAGQLRRAVTFLRKIGIEVTFSREGRGRERKIQIVSTEAIRLVSEVMMRSSKSSAPTASVTNAPTRDQNVAVSPNASFDGADDVADCVPPARSVIVRDKSLKNGSADVAYCADANFSSVSQPPTSKLRGTV
jgi:hypothetical protein